MEAFAHDGPSVVGVRIDDRATPINFLKQPVTEGADKTRARPGAVYTPSDWKVSPEM